MAPLGSQNKQLMLNRPPLRHTSVFILQRSDGGGFADQFSQSRRPRCGTATVIPSVLGRVVGGRGGFYGKKLLIYFLAVVKQPAFTALLRLLNGDAG